MFKRSIQCLNKPITEFIFLFIGLFYQPMGISILWILGQEAKTELS